MRQFFKCILLTILFVAVVMHEDATAAGLSELLSPQTGGVITMYGTDVLEKLETDDPVGAIPVHGFAGVWGTLSVGLFALAPYSTTMTGLFFGGSAAQLLVQSLVALAVLLWTLGATYLVFTGIQAWHGLGFNDAREMMDLDTRQELDLINNAILSVDIESAHNSRS